MIYGTIRTVTAAMMTKHSHTIAGGTLVLKYIKGRQNLAYSSTWFTTCVAPIGEQKMPAIV